MTKIKTFTGNSTMAIDKSVNEFLKDKRYVDLKVRTFVKPAAGFVHPEGYQTAIGYIFTLIYEE